MEGGRWGGCDVAKPPLLSWSSLPSPAKSPQLFLINGPQCRWGWGAILRTAWCPQGLGSAQMKGLKGRQQKRWQMRAKCRVQRRHPPSSLRPQPAGVEWDKGQAGNTREAGIAPDWAIRYSDPPAYPDCLSFPDFNE